MMKMVSFLLDLLLLLRSTQLLKSMPKGKSPGPDGLNVEFYFSCWNIAKDPFLDAIQYFF